MKECCRKYLCEQFGDDMDVVGEIYGEYARSAAEKTDEAFAAFAVGDWTLLDRTAHTLKGNALAAGDQDTADAAIALRKAVALKDADEAKALAEKLRALVSAL